MKQLDIDFAAPGLARSLYRTGPALWALLAAGLLLCAVAAMMCWRLMEQQAANDAQLAALRQRQIVMPALPVARAPGVSEQQAAAINAAILQLNLPWRALHDAIGAATPAAVALLALEPDPRKRSIKITAEARSSDDMIAYLEKLKQQELFAGVTLVRHEINEQDPNRPIRFQIDARWSAP